MRLQGWKIEGKRGGGGGGRDRKREKTTERDGATDT